MTISGGFTLTKLSMSFIYFKVFSYRKGFGEGSSDSRLQTALENDAVDQKYGFHHHKETSERVGWLLNMHSV